MRNETDPKRNYEFVFKRLVDETCSYLVDNHLSSMVLGISGGVDSTVVAAICYEVSRKTGIPLIGRSLPINNRRDEFHTSLIVGKAFCTDFKDVNLISVYQQSLSCLIHNEADTNLSESELNEWHYSNLEDFDGRNKIVNGNLQARLRMMYLYDLASINKGIVISTDNQTEYQLGFWTLHGDVGDFNPLFGLWKTEVYELANWLLQKYSMKHCEYLVKVSKKEEDSHLLLKIEALKTSIALTPTDGLGISNSDLEQLGANSYEEVDSILQEFEAYQCVLKDYLLGMNASERVEMFLRDQEMLDIDIDIIKKVIYRHINSEFKRKNLPICITRNKYEHLL